jgi:hypothetical protein
MLEANADHEARDHRRDRATAVSALIGILLMVGLIGMPAWLPVCSSRQAMSL